MIPIRSLALAVASAALVVSHAARAATISENFAANPFQNGWQIYGPTNAFIWNSTNQTLSATWDSRQPNTFFYHALPWYLTRSDDFHLEFDLLLNDIAPGIEPDKTTPIQLGFGFLSLSGVTNASFMRGAYGNAPNVAEFDYYAHGYYIFDGIQHDSPAATVPGFISAIDSFAYSPSNISPYDNELPTNQWVHVTFGFIASNQTASVTTATTNGLVTLPSLVLTATNGFADTDNFHADIFSVSSYSGAGDDYDSILAHGSLANLVVTLPPPAQNVRGAFVGGNWQVTFSDKLNWNYTLERTTNWFGWSQITPPIAGNGTNLILLDTNPPPGRAFYRVSATRP